MSWFKTASDADLHQSLELASQAAQEATATGDRARAAAFHEDINGMLDEAQERGWTQNGSGWEPGRKSS